MSDRPPADPPTWQALMLDGLMGAYAGARTNGDPFDFTASSFNLESELASCHEQWLKLREAPAPKCEDCRFASHPGLGAVCLHHALLESTDDYYDDCAYVAHEVRIARRDSCLCGPEGRLFEAAK